MQQMILRSDRVRLFQRLRSGGLVAIPFDQYILRCKWGAASPRARAFFPSRRLG
jgi:hypothetical protein